MHSSRGNYYLRFRLSDWIYSRMKNEVHFAVFDLTGSWGRNPPLGVLFRHLQDPQQLVAPLPQLQRSFRSWLRRALLHHILLAYFKEASFQQPSSMRLNSPCNWEAYQVFAYHQLWPKSHIFFTVFLKHPSFYYSSKLTIFYLLLSFHPKKSNLEETPDLLQVHHLTQHSLWVYSVFSLFGI